MVATVWIAVRIVMVPAVNVVRKTSTCAKMATAYTVIAILLALVHYNATLRANVSVNQVSLVPNVIAAMPTIINLVHTVVKHVVATHAAHWTIYLLVILKRAFVIAKKMWRVNVVMSKYF